MDGMFEQRMDNAILVPPSVWQTSEKTQKSTKNVSKSHQKSTKNRAWDHPGALGGDLGTILAPGRPKAQKWDKKTAIV